MIRVVSKLHPLTIEIIAPSDQLQGSDFANVKRDRSSYRSRLSDLQKFRGRIYGKDGLNLELLDNVGRLISPLDTFRWHLLIVNPEDNEIHSSMSLRLFKRKPLVEELSVYDMICDGAGLAIPAYRLALQRLINKSQAEGLYFSEVGGWAVDPDSRGGPAALTTVLSCWSLQRALGGNSLSVATAGKLHKADRILMRLGGTKLDESLPHFYDQKYKSNIEVIAFDTRHPTPQAIEAIQDIHRRMVNCRVYADAA